MKLLDIPRGILFVHLIGDAVHSCAGFFLVPESRVQRLGRDQMSDRKELSLRILLGQFGYSVDLCGHSLSKSEPRLCSFRQIRASVPPFPPVGPVAAPFGSPAVSTSQVHMVRKTAHPSVDGRLQSPLASMLPLSQAEMASLSWVPGESIWNMPRARDSGDLVRPSQFRSSPSAAFRRE